MSWPAFPQLGKLPEPPYWAAIFISEKSDELDGYPEMDRATIEMAQKSEGFLGYASSNEEGKGIFISYWKSEEAIDQWRKNSLHLAAKAQGKKSWYSRYVSQIVEIKQHGIK